MYKYTIGKPSPAPFWHFWPNSSPMACLCLLRMAPCCMSSKCWKSFNEELFLEIFLEAIGNFWGLTSSQRLWQSSYDLRDWVSKIIKNVWWEGGRSQILLNFSFSWQPYQSISFSWRHSMVSAIYAICTVGRNL